MNFLILGDGPEELAWAQAIQDHPEHAVTMACPGLKALPAIRSTEDLDAALAAARVDAAVIGGWPDLRSEGLRRAAAEGLAILALHPPGPNADPYYQVALSRQETGAVVVPDLPLRLHPGFADLEKAIGDGRLGTFRGVRYEATLAPDSPDADLLGRALPRTIDALRALLGDIEAINAHGQPPGDRPRDGLTVHVRGPLDRNGEIRLNVGRPLTQAPARWVVNGAEGSLALEHDLDLLGPSRLVERSASGVERVTEIPPWDPKAAVLRVLTDSVASHSRPPDLLDGTRALEVAEAVGRSLRKGRTVDLHYEEISELGSFKAFMTSLGCGLLLLVPIIYTLTRVGLVFGLDWMRYVAWALPVLLLVFAMLQLLRFAARPPGPAAEKPVAVRESGEAG